MWKLRALKKKIYVCMNRQHPKSSWNRLRRRRKKWRVIKRIQIHLLIMNGQEGYSSKDIHSLLIKH